MLKSTRLDTQKSGSATRTRYRPTAVSRALQAVNEQIESGRAFQPNEDQRTRTRSRMLVAANRAMRARAYRLAQKVYAKRGYAELSASKWCVTPYDADPRTVALLALDAEGADGGTISLICDGENGMPCDEIFHEDLAELRAQGRQLAEVTRLAVNDGVKNSKEILVRLFDWVSVYARRLQNVDDFIIEVNPRHVNFYRRLLMFEPIGQERPCPRVGGAPAVLLRLDMHMQEEVIGRVGDTRGKLPGPESRTLYAHFRTLSQERDIADYMRRHHRQISADDLRYFGITPHPPRTRQTVDSTRP